MTQDDPTTAGPPATRGPGRPRTSEQETARIRETIIAAAERSFAATGGYRSVTVTLMIEEAGLTRTAFYRHFRNADEPMQIVFDRFGSDLHELITQRVAPVPYGPARVVAGIDAYLEWSRRYRHLLPAVMADIYDTASPMAGIRRATLEAIVALISHNYEDSEYPPPSRTTLDIFVNTIEYTCLRLFVDTAGEEADVATARTTMLQIAVALLGSPRSWRQLADAAEAQAGATAQKPVGDPG